ncbi:MAG: class I SAM-dependent methyltransferase [Candidatus Bilamarchaeaceae archaeon]
MQQWNEVFKKEGKYFTKIREEIPGVLKLFKDRDVKRILDLGCGSGRHTVYFAKKGFVVYGIDIAKQGIKITKSWLKKENVKANLKIGSIYRKLPYPNDFFDAVISTQTIHHARIGNVRKAIREIERVLKQHGLIFVTVARKIKRRYKQIAPRTYVPTEGVEKGLPHYIFNKKLLKKEFKNFRIFRIWVDSYKGQYCLLGELKRKSNSHTAHTSSSALNSLSQ